MKRPLLFLLALLAAGVAHAGPFEWGARQDPGTIFYRVSGATTAILVDLSDTSTYPHKQTGFANITSIHSEVTKSPVAVGTVTVGVVTGVDASSGTVRWFFAHDFSRETSTVTLSVMTMDLTETSVRAKVVNGAYGFGTTPYLLSNYGPTRSTVYQTDVDMVTSAGGLAKPAIGDIVVDFAFGTGAADLTLRLIYFTEK